MGRPKGYSRDEVTRKALALFWAKGYDGTSTRALAEGMGVNIYSLFAEFESKQGLYEEALALYRREVVETVFGKLDSPTAGLEDLFALLDFFATRAGAADAARGCFACNVATERAPHDLASRDFVAGHVEYLERVLCSVLSNAQMRGELRDDVSCIDQSRLLTSTLLGFFVLMRAGVAQEFVQSAARSARHGLEGLRKPPANTQA